MGYHIWKDKSYDWKRVIMYGRIRVMIVKGYHVWKDKSWDCKELSYMNRWELRVDILNGYHVWKDKSWELTL